MTSSTFALANLHFGDAAPQEEMEELRSSLPKKEWRAVQSVLGSTGWVLKMAWTRPSGQGKPQRRFRLDGTNGVPRSPVLQSRPQLGRWCLAYLVRRCF